MKQVNNIYKLILNTLLTTFPTLMPKLANVYDKWKQSNPLVATVVLGLLVGIQFILTKKVIPIENELLADTIQLFLMIITALTGSRTYEFKDKPEEKIEK